MPEGSTLHRLARELGPLVGLPLRASSPQGRFTTGAEVLDGRCLDGIEAVGKHLLADFGDVHLHVHLGLAGTMYRTSPDSSPRPSVRLRLVAEAEGVAWDLVAPNRCELWDDVERDALLARLGPDPLRGDDPAPAFDRIRRSPRTIGELLLDQAVVSGIGNVFRAEVLHLCGLHPLRPGSSLCPDDLACLWERATALMARATEEGRIVTVEVPPGVDRASIEPTAGRYVYKQAACRNCGNEVRTWPLGARVAYACETCQPAA